MMSISSSKPALLPTGIRVPGRQKFIPISLLFTDGPGIPGNRVWYLITLPGGNGLGNIRLVPSVPESPFDMLFCWFLTRREDPLPWEVPALALHCILDLLGPEVGPPQSLTTAHRQLSFLEPLGRVFGASGAGQED